MAPLLGLLEIGIAAAVTYGAINYLRRHQSVFWWTALAVAAAIGVLIGTWFGFSFSYRPHPDVVFYSFPVPAHFYALERYPDGTQQWMNFPTSAPELTAIGNTCFVASIGVMIVWLACFMWTSLERLRCVGQAPPDDA
jgi:hypothetical protein